MCPVYFATHVTGRTHRTRAGPPPLRPSLPARFPPPGPHTYIMYVKKIVAERLDTYILYVCARTIQMTQGQ